MDFTFAYDITITIYHSTPAVAQQCMLHFRGRHVDPRAILGIGYQCKRDQTRDRMAWNTYSILVSPFFFEIAVHKGVHLIVSVS
jgi:hypothetical protein